MRRTEKDFKGVRGTFCDCDSYDGEADLREWLCTIYPSSHTSISIEEFGIFDMDCNQIQIMTWRISILSLLTIPVLLSDPLTRPWPR